MTTTTRSTSNRIDNHNGLIASITEVIPLPASTCSRTETKSDGIQNHDEFEDDAALEGAFAEEEERFIDEEISSYDEDGRPVVDTEALEHRHLTVALVQSCVDQQSITRHQSALPRRESSSSNSSPSSPTSDHHRYGLRPRSFVAKSRSSSPSRIPSPGSRKRERPSSNQKTISSTASKFQQAPGSPPSTTGPRNPNPQPPTITSLVPNPLIAPPNSKPLQPPPSMLLATNKTNAISSSIPTKSHTTLSSPFTTSASTSSSFSSAATTPTTSNRAVQLPSDATFVAAIPSQQQQHLLTATTKTSTPKSVAIAEPPATVAELTFLSPSTSATATRGRIFSIDIDPGFDFSDMALDSLQPPDYGPQQQPQSLLAISQHKDSITSTSTTISLPVDLPAVVANEGRNRAFSFEFFSFLDDTAQSSIFDGTTVSASVPNDDDTPDPILSSSLVGVDDDHRCYEDDVKFHSRRPRGDSIIFDPVSFQDGGIHETNALAKVRSGSVASSSLSIGSNTGAMPSAVPSSSMTTTLSSSDSCRHRRVPEVATSCDYATTSAKNCASSSQHIQVSTVLPFTTTSMNCMTPTPSAVTATSAGNGPSVSSTASPFPMELLNKDGRIGIYLPEARRVRIARFHAKRKLRIWRKRIKYDCRKKLADSRPRIKGRFVKRSDLDDDE